MSPVAGESGQSAADGALLHTEHRRRGGEDILATDRVRQAADPDVGVVEPAAPEALEIVVVGIAGVDMRVDVGAVSPLIVGVAGAVCGVVVSATFCLIAGVAWGRREEKLA